MALIADGEHANILVEKDPVYLIVVKPTSQTRWCQAVQFVFVGIGVFFITRFMQVIAAWTVADAARDLGADLRTGLSLWPIREFVIFASIAGMFLCWLSLVFVAVLLIVRRKTVTQLEFTGSEIIVHSPQLLFRSKRVPIHLIKGSRLWGFWPFFQLKLVRRFDGPIRLMFGFTRAEIMAVQQLLDGMIKDSVRGVQGAFREGQAEAGVGQQI